MLNVVVHIVVVVRGFAISFVMVVVIFLPLSNCHFSITERCRSHSNDINTPEVELGAPSAPKNQTREKYLSIHFANDVRTIFFSKKNTNIT